MDNVVLGNGALTFDEVVAVARLGAAVVLGAWVSSQLPCSFLEQEEGYRREQLT